MRPIPYSRPAIAKLIASHITSSVEKGTYVFTRVDFNILCRATSNATRTEILSSVLLNLLEYGYLHRCATDTTVAFWPTDKLIPGISALTKDLEPGPLPTRSSGYHDFLETAGDAVPMYKTPALADLQGGQDSTPEENESDPSSQDGEEVSGGEAEVKTAQLHEDEETPTFVDTIEARLVPDEEPPASIRTLYRRAFVMRYLKARTDIPLPTLISALGKIYRPLIVERDLKSLLDEGLIHIGKRGGTHYVELPYGESTPAPEARVIETPPPTKAAPVATEQSTAPTSDDGVIREITRGAIDLNPTDRVFVLALIRRLQAQ
jgi:hypothetical protein